MNSHEMHPNDPRLHSWIDSANDPKSDFPIQNLPFGVFRHVSGHGQPAICVAIGDRILDLRGCQQDGLLDDLAPAIQEACTALSLNALMALGRGAATALRVRLSGLLRIGQPTTRENHRKVEQLLTAADEVMLLPPAVIGDYTDFYASVHHATNVGKLFRPDNPLLPNYKYVPIGYHGRASSIVVSGTPVRRPGGQSKIADATAPLFGPSNSLDYELEVGFFVGRGNKLGHPISIDRASEHIFGLCLVNDWSARDLQAWEYQPLGPFVGKNFATTISPWVVTLDALEPFRVPAFQRAEGDPTPLPYINSREDQALGGLDLILEASLSSQAMRDRAIAPLRVSRGNMRDLYWTMAQMVTHHASNGCNLRAGDLMASGTISGSTADSLGSLLEISRRGASPIQLPTGETRSFLEDGDEVIFEGWCEREGHTRIGFGGCRGSVLPARK
jgi:fumarylacetoacetase